MRWCPAPNCTNAVKVSHVEAKPVTCRCGHKFCFACSENWHDPVRCHLIKKWIKKCDDDSETSNWINANTKECPTCNATIGKSWQHSFNLIECQFSKELVSRNCYSDLSLNCTFMWQIYLNFKRIHDLKWSFHDIDFLVLFRFETLYFSWVCRNGCLIMQFSSLLSAEKDGGCNHMICKNQACKADFCWVCLGPWEPHGSSWYNCNRYDEDEAKAAREGQEKSRSALQRYLFYCNRYMNHLQSLKFENKLYTMVKVLFFSFLLIVLNKIVMM